MHLSRVPCSVENGLTYILTIGDDVESKTKRETEESCCGWTDRDPKQTRKTRFTQKVQSSHRPLEPFTSDTTHLSARRRVQGPRENTLTFLDLPHTPTLLSSLHRLKDPFLDSPLSQGPVLTWISSRRPGSPLELGGTSTRRVPHIPGLD